MTTHYKLNIPEDQISIGSYCNKLKLDLVNNQMHAGFINMTDGKVIEWLYKVKREQPYIDLEVELMNDIDEKTCGFYLENLGLTSHSFDLDNDSTDNCYHECSFSFKKWY